MPSVLVIDDEEDVVDTIADILSQINGVTITKTIQTDKAVSLLNETQFDYVVCDYNLQDGTGIDIFKIARKAQPQAKFYLITGTALNSNTHPEIKNMHGFLYKPFKIEEIEGLLFKEFITQDELDDLIG
ncbi:MAG: response regulator [Bacteriovoracaceae bacterium]|jgi:DNA-binding NtrC family response regulator|nr:response regulator [Bacteriovoracaceae bacterium]